VGVAALAAWLGSSWLSTYRQAQATQALVTSLRGDLSAKKWDAVSAQVPKVAASTAALAEATDGVQWQVLSSLPVIGSTATAVHEMAASLSGLAVAAEPLTPYADRIVAGQLRTPSGAIDVASFATVAPLLKHLSSELDASAKQLGAIALSDVRPEVSGPLGELRDAIVQTAPTVATAADVAAWVPAMMGADKPRDWLVLLQNPAEARGSGGFVGGYVVLRSDKGSISATSSGTSTDLTTTPIPTEAAPADSRLLWGDLLQAWNTYNLSPHFPLTAELSAAGMKARGKPVSGVIAVDPATIAAMLSVTGPVTAAGYTIDASNVEQFFTVDIYAKIADNTERDVVSMQLVSAVLAAFLAAQPDPVALIEALKEPVAGGHLLVWSAEPDEQAWLASTGVGGELPDSAGSVVAVAFNNAAANKLDAFVQTEVDYAPGRCVTKPLQSSSLSVRVRNDTPASLTDPSGIYGRLDDPAAPAGSTNMLVHIYAPLGANFLSATIDGKDAPLYLGEERNRPVWWTYLPVERGQERVIDVQFEEPMVLGVEPRVIPQSMVMDQMIRVTPQPEC
jgi:hypothetical protein